MQVSANTLGNWIDRLFQRYIPERFLQSEHVFLAKVLWVYSIVLGVMGLLVLLALSVSEGEIQLRRVGTVSIVSLFMITPILIHYCKSIVYVSAFVFTVTTVAVFYIDFNNRSLAGPSLVLWVIPIILAAMSFTGKRVFFAFILIFLLGGLNAYFLKAGLLPPAIVHPENWLAVQFAYLVIVGVMVMICTWGMSKLASRHLSQLNQELENKEKTIQQINQLKIAAESSTQSKSMFLATMSHELRTPLNSVIGNAQLLARADLPMKHHAKVNDIAIAGNLLLMLINDILDFSKLEQSE